MTTNTTGTQKGPSKAGYTVSAYKTGEDDFIEVTISDNKTQEEVFFKAFQINHVTEERGCVLNKASAKKKAWAQFSEAR